MNEPDKTIDTYVSKEAKTPAQILEMWRSMLDTIKKDEKWEVELGSETDTICWIYDAQDRDNALTVSINQHTGIVEVERNFRQDSLMPASLKKQSSIRWSACYVSFLLSMEFTKKQHAGDLINWLHTYFGE